MRLDLCKTTALASRVSFRILVALLVDVDRLLLILALAMKFNTALAGVHMCPGCGRYS